MVLWLYLPSTEADRPNASLGSEVYCIFPFVALVSQFTESGARKGYKFSIAVPGCTGVVPSARAGVPTKLIKGFSSGVLIEINRDQLILRLRSPAES